MATPYSNVFQRFLRKIYDIELANTLKLNTNIAIDKMIGYLDSAIVNYPQCDKNLKNRDINAQQFNNTLDDNDEEILATLMIPEYMSPFIVSILNLKPFLTDSEYKTESIRLGLANKMAVKKEYEDKAETLINKYSYQDSNINDFN